jgi:hypothetical protein
MSEAFSPAQKPDGTGESGPSAPAIIGATVGVLFLILAITIVLIVIHRRHTDQLSNVTADETEMGHEYDNPLTIQQVEMDLCYATANMAELTLFE